MNYMCLAVRNPRYYTEETSLTKRSEFQLLLLILKHNEQINTETSAPTCRQLLFPRFPNDIMDVIGAY